MKHRLDLITARSFLSLGLLIAMSALAHSAESLWLEAEHFVGLKGYCWPMGTPAMKKTNGHWGLSGPGWAAEWNQGGESGFLSIAAGGDDDKATVTKTVEVPVAGKWKLWVRYGDWREVPERFQLQVEQAGKPPFIAKFGERPMVEEDNEAKLYWNWAFVWDHRELDLSAGQVTLKLMTTTQDPQPRQIDVVVLTTDAEYRPRVKERPRDHAWEILDGYRASVPADLPPLTRTRPDFAKGTPALPERWKMKTHRDKGFLYMWNVSHTDASQTWLGDKPDRVPVPYNVGDAETRAEFEKLYAGKKDVPIFGDPRIVPTFHGVGPGVFATDPKTGELLPIGQKFAAWLEQNPDRAWGMMMNYHGGAPIGPKGIEAFQKFRDRYVGSISGESLGYFYPDAKEMQAVTANAKTRRELVSAFTPLSLRLNAEKYKAVFGKDLDKNPYGDVIPCLSVGNITWAPICSQWGAKTLGYESSSMTSSLLPMRMAFMRGLSRQGGHTYATYRSCNFGDASTIFSNQQSYTSPQAIFDNYYSVFSGAGTTWYKFDIWYQYMAGAGIFYHEQGFDEFWKPGGTTAAGKYPVQLSPKGKLVDRFLRVTAAQPDRGNPYTPVAFLVDYAHGWEPAGFWPNSFKNWHQNQERFLFGDHEKMLEQWFWSAYHPIGPESQKPITALNEVYLPGVFGDMFDVIAAFPEVERWTTIDTYPAVVAVGEIELTAAEGKRLAAYIAQGGTLVIADAHLTGPGVAALQLPATGGESAAEGYRWFTDQADAKLHPSPRFRFKPIQVPAGKPGPSLQPLATTEKGEVFCVSMDREKGRLIYLSTPHGLTISKQLHPAVPQLLAHLTRGLMPVEVQGEVEWLLNRTAKGWAVTLLNPAGQDKPQQGITPTDYRQNKRVTIKSHLPITSAKDRLLLDDPLKVEQGSVTLEVPAGGVRVVELE